MMVKIDRLLPPDQLAIVRRALDEAPFVDGRLSAGSAASRGKKNREMDQKSEGFANLSRILMGALYAHPLFRGAALPLRSAAPFFARYGIGETYGDHIDDPVMGDERGRFRCDVATTVFLNDPDEYEGGELVVRTPFGEQRVKLPAGAAVVYPASSLHRVDPVRRGERLVMVTWTQSMVRDAYKREVLFELNEAREALLDADPTDEKAKKVDHAYTNLVRMWAEV